MPDAEYMREYRKKKKLERLKAQETDNSETDNKENIEKPDNSEHKAEYIEPQIIKNDNPVKKKSNKIQSPITPDGFADFSVSTERTSLAFRKAKLEEFDKKHIENSARALAGIYDIPQFMVIADYIIAMGMPHVNLTLDRMSAKAELEIIQLADKLRSDGFDVDTKTLLAMTEKQREEYISRLEKDKKLKDLKKDVFNKDDIVVGD